MSKTLPIALFCVFLSIFLTACISTFHRTESNLVNHKPKKIALQEKTTNNIKKQLPGEEEHSNKTNEQGNLSAKSAEPHTSQQSKNPSDNPFNNEDIQVVGEPDSISVLVNKQNKLPDSYTPKDLIYTNVPFIVSEKSERTKMKREAANAIELLFSDAKEQGVHLLGVSAYRSHVEQVALFNYYAKRDGYNNARTYSAIPGTSEHETGLAIDVTGGNGSCAAMDCFGNTKEANWLQNHAADYGFIIRYPKGKDSITGYKYEPWHLRFIGTPMAKEIMSQGITLEEYFGIVPVNH